MRYFIWCIPLWRPNTMWVAAVPLPAGMLAAELNWTEKGMNQFMKRFRSVCSLKRFVCSNDTFATDTTLLHGCVKGFLQCSCGKNHGNRKTRKCDLMKWGCPLTRALSVITKGGQAVLNTGIKKMDNTLFTETQRRTAVLKKEKKVDHVHPCSHAQELN